MEKERLTCLKRSSFFSSSSMSLDILMAAASTSDLWLSFTFWAMLRYCGQQMLAHLKRLSRWKDSRGETKGVVISDYCQSLLLPLLLENCRAVSEPLCSFITIINLLPYHSIYFPFCHHHRRLFIDLELLDLQKIYPLNYINNHMETECPHLTEQHYTKSLQGRKIYKDQCVRCFSQPTHPDGLFVCLKCFNGFCSAHIAAHQHTHNHPIYLRITSTPTQAEQKVEITKLAIGVEGGAIGEDQYETRHEVWCNSCGKHVQQGDKLLQAQVQSLINTDSPFKKQSLAVWEVQIQPCEHTLTLHQQVVNKNLQHCSDCQLSTNLWLCLTCGNTGCGRKNWDGSGGNSHGITHFEHTGHPLVVKLGTITAEGDASLYCYSCNNDVRDDLLAQHMIFLGIEVKDQRKTEKTVAQINLDLNLNFALSKLLTSKDNEAPMYGAAHTGINNIGNSCYLNSVLQSLNALPQFQHQYYSKGELHVAECKKIPAECFYCQVSKVFWGLNSGRYSQRKERKRIINQIQSVQQFQEGIKPYDFKLLIAKGNTEFSSNRQQDALEYLQLLFDRLDKEEPFIGVSSTLPFSFQSLNRLVCQACSGYKLVETKTNEWKFPVPLPTQQHINAYYQQLDQEDSETRKAKLCEDPEYQVKMDDCLSILRQGDAVVARCEQCKSQQVFLSKNYLKTTPKYLLAVPNRFIVEKWVPKKLNALIDVPQHFDISEFLINNAPAAGHLLTGKPSPKAYSHQNVDMLVGMGFSENAAKRALIQAKDNLEAASNWIMENMDNYEINKAIEEEAPASNSVQVDATVLAEVINFGFEEQQGRIALIKHANNQEAALEWLFGVEGDVSGYLHLLDPPKQSVVVQKYEKPTHTAYQLRAVIIHLGKSVHSGHYVAYVRQGTDWLLFNDEKVTLSSAPVLGKGYIYLYEGL